MKYRWKLLILLLSISIIPMAGARFFGVHSVRQLGDELVTRTRERIVTDTEDRLKLLVNAYSQILWKSREQVEMALLMQRSAVERVLKAKPPYPANVFFATDFNRGDRLPPDTFPSSVHFKSLKNGGTEVLRISYSTQVFKLAPGTTMDRVGPDLASLSLAGPTYKQIHEPLRDMVAWHHTILENGLHSFYPGHSGIPDRLDFRQFPWYREAANSPVPWSDPYVDPATRQVVVAAAAPVYRADGVLGGVTALVVPIGRMLNQRLLVSSIPPKSKAYLCYIAKDPATGQRSARIFAKQDHADVQHRSWRAHLGTEWLVSKDDRQFQAMLDDILTGRGNIRTMAFEGCGCTWAYGPIQGAAFVVVIIPETEIFKPVDEAERSVQESVGSLIRMTGYGLTGIILLVIVLAFSFSKTVTRPLQALLDGSLRLAEGDFKARVAIHSKDEFGEMGKVFNYIVPRLADYTQMSRSIALAGEVQRSLLPKSNPSVERLDIAGVTISCDETGGDYYDYLDMGEIRGDRVGIVVGDVSDHGLPSALLMASARSYLRQRAAMPGTISEIVSDVNRQMTRDVEETGRFMTLFFCVIDTAYHRIRWVRAGHDPGMVYDPASERFESLAGAGISLGVSEDTVYEESWQRIAPGQILVIGTDGIWETHNAEGGMFGKERLQNIVQANAESSSRGMVESVIAALEAFRGPVRQEDDVTLVVIKVNQ